MGSASWRLRSMVPRTPFTNFAEFSLPNCFASSTASFIAAFTGVPLSSSISRIARRRMFRSIARKLLHRPLRRGSGDDLVDLILLCLYAVDQHLSECRRLRRYALAAMIRSQAHPSQGAPRCPPRRAPEALRRAPGGGFPSPSVHHQSAVYSEDRARDVAGLLGREEDCARRDLLRCRPAPSGTNPSTACCCASVRSAVISVFTRPGAIAFAVMLRDATSLATDFVKPISPLSPRRSSPGQRSLRGLPRSRR